MSLNIRIVDDVYNTAKLAVISKKVSMAVSQRNIVKTFILIWITVNNNGRGTKQKLFWLCAPSICDKWYVLSLLIAAKTVMSKKWILYLLPKSESPGKSSGCVPDLPNQNLEAWDWLAIIWQCPPNASGISSENHW